MNGSADVPSAAAPRPGGADSPWFWASLFSWFALIALFLIGPKYFIRQERLERRQAGRAVSWMRREAAKGATASTGESETPLKPPSPAERLEPDDVQNSDQAQDFEEVGRPDDLEEARSALSPGARMRLGLIGATLSLVFAVSMWKWRTAVRAFAPAPVPQEAASGEFGK